MGMAVSRWREKEFPRGACLAPATDLKAERCRALACQANIRKRGDPLDISNTRRRMTRRQAAAALAFLAAVATTKRSLAFAEADEAALRALVDGPQRSEKNRARDVYRHPLESLAFIGVEPASTVVEIY